VVRSKRVVCLLTAGFLGRFVYRLVISPSGDAAGGLSLSYDNGWTDRNADYCVNTDDEKKYYGHEFGVIPETLWFICRGGEST